MNVINLFSLVKCSVFCGSEYHYSCIVVEKHL